jgi:hypothetical protein
MIFSPDPRNIGYNIKEEVARLLLHNQASRHASAIKGERQTESELT